MRHLTFFEMLGNFSIGDYFKQERGPVRARALHTEGFGLRLRATSGSRCSAATRSSGSAPTRRRSTCWRSVGVPDERIVLLGREDNFWQAGPTGPCGPCSELYLDRGPDFGADDDRPGDDTERFLEFWNLVFMQYELHEDGSLTDAADAEHRHRPGARPHGGDPAGRPVGVRDRPLPAADRARRGAVRHAVRRRRRDHPRAADPRRPRARRRRSCSPTASSRPTRSAATCCAGSCAARSSRVTCSASSEPFLPELAERVSRDVMGDAYPDLQPSGRHDRGWARAEEESFGRTLEQGRAPARRGGRAREGRQTSWISAEDAFKLHDTFGFPYELTKELLAEEGLAVDDQGFEELMERAREVARAAASARHGGAGGDEHVARRGARFARGAGFRTRFVGYETTGGGHVARARRARQRPAAREARGEPLLRGGRRPGLGLRHDRDAIRRARAWSTSTGWATTRRWRSSRSRASWRGRAGHGGRRPRPPARDDAQPHRDAPAARRAARAARHARAPGRLLRGPGQAALRLHPRRAAVAPRSSPTVEDS